MWGVGGGGSGWQMRVLHECFRGKQGAELSSPAQGLLKTELGNMHCIVIAGEKLCFTLQQQSPDKWVVEECSRGCNQ